MEEEEQEFETVWASEVHTSRKPLQYIRELNACREIEQSLVQECLQSTIGDITGQCHDEYENGVRSQIFTVSFRKNQEVQFDSFVQQLQERFEENSESIFQGQGSIKVQLLRKSQVRQIVLHMYIYLQENPEFELVVFVVSAMTDLDQRNLYCFEKGLKGKRFVVVLCTVSNFENKHESGLQHFQKYHYRLYNSRDLFCKYLFCCLVSPVIRPYLPPGVLSLISDIDFYTISFHESCRRFTYCLERFLMLSGRQRELVEFAPLLGLIENAVTSKFTYYPGVKDPNEKILKVILDQREIYTISEKAIVYEIAFASGVTKKEELDEDSIIRSIRQSLRKHLAREPRFAVYVDYLEEREEGKEIVQRKKRSRADQLGIDTKKNITPKNKLENQITRIIKEATASIRQQAAAVRWIDIKYQLRIKPQLPYLIKEAWSSDEETAGLMQQVSKNYFAPLGKYLSNFSEEEAGRGLYLLKCLELAGLVEISKKHIKPIVYTTFFEKAKFSGTCQ